MIYDIFIIGGGPGGLTAAIYGARAGFSVLIAEPGLPGGQMTLTHEIENYPGFPEGIDGFTLGEKFLAQAQRWGAERIQEKVISILPEHGPWQIRTDKREYTAKTVIIATGATPKVLGIPGEERLKGRGVSYCGTCDGPLYRNKTVTLIGGGNTAFQEADFLLRFVKHLNIVHHRSTFRAQKALVDKIHNKENVTFYTDCTPLEILGDPMVSGVKVRHNDTEATEVIPTDGVFFFIGHKPETGFANGVVETDDTGRILTDGSCACAMPGLYAIGDVRSKSSFQIATAVGDGATVIHTIENYLSQIEQTAEKAKELVHCK